MAVDEKLVVLADEVYQANIWKKGASFSSFKKVRGAGVYDSLMDSFGNVGKSKYPSSFSLYGVSGNRKGWKCHPNPAPWYKYRYPELFSLGTRPTHQEAGTLFVDELLCSTRSVCPPLSARYVRDAGVA